MKPWEHHIGQLLKYKLCKRVFSRSSHCSVIVAREFAVILTTDDECTSHANLATRYQLAQFVLKISFALVKKVGQGEMGGFQYGVLCTWQLPWLAVEKPWPAPAWSFLSLLTQTGVDKAPLPLQGLYFWHCRQFSDGRSVHWFEGPDHCKLANEWAWQKSLTQVRDLMEMLS